MKKLIFCLFVMFILTGSANSFAGEHLANVTWTTNVLVGYDSVLGGSVYGQTFSLDVGIGGEFYTVNGVVDTLNGSQACTGSGFHDVDGGITLDMQCGTSQVVFSLNKQTLNGEIHVVDYNDIYIDSAPLLYQSQR